MHRVPHWNGNWFYKAVAIFFWVLIYCHCATFKFQIQPRNLFRSYFFPIWRLLVVVGFRCEENSNMSNICIYRHLGVGCSFLMCMTGLSKPIFDISFQVCHSLSLFLVLCACVKNLNAIDVSRLICCGCLNYMLVRSNKSSTTIFLNCKRVSNTMPSSFAWDWKSKRERNWHKLRVKKRGAAQNKKANECEKRRYFHIPNLLILNIPWFVFLYCLP